MLYTRDNDVFLNYKRRFNDWSQAPERHEAFSNFMNTTFFSAARRAILAYAGVAAIICWGSSIPSFAATFVVSDTLDSTNVTSFRGAIMAANVVGGVNTIFLTGASYPLTISGADEGGAYSGDLNITNGCLIIEGVSASATRVDATGLGDRVFQVSSNAQLILLNLTIQGGSPPAAFNPAYAFEGEPGGAIFIQDH